MSVEEVPMGHPPEDDWKHKPGETSKSLEAENAENAEPVRFRVNGREYELAEVDDLEFGELEMIEDAFGLPADEIDWRRTKATRWLIYLSMKRAGANVKFEELATIRFSAVEDVEDPTEPVAE